MEGKKKQKKESCENRKTHKKKRGGHQPGNRGNSTHLWNILQKKNRKEQTGVGELKVTKRPLERSWTVGMRRKEKEH